MRIAGKESPAPTNFLLRSGRLVAALTSDALHSNDSE